VEDSLITVEGVVGVFDVVAGYPSSERVVFVGYIRETNAGACYHVATVIGVFGAIVLYEVAEVVVLIFGSPAPGEVYLLSRLSAPWHPTIKGYFFFAGS